jgi:hypothetical protein
MFLVHEHFGVKKKHEDAFEGTQRSLFASMDPRQT